ncbi:MAG: GFA family protein [Solirubrobacteraceae bacterium]|nr:GFA family protein [Solirubrobacteraceae bacterium]
MTGGCLCGAVRFELTAPPTTATYCHCTRCQRRTGTAASAQAVIAPGSLRWLAGEDEVRFWWPEGGGFGKGFCPACGAHICSKAPGADEPWSIRMGAFDEDPGVRPSLRQWVGSAAPWEPIPDDGLPRFEGSAKG